MGHLTKWLFFNLTFGAIPYALVVALNQLHAPGPPRLHPSSEVLFIALVATSSALGELWDDGEPWGRRPYPHGRSYWRLGMLFGVLSTSLLYGAYVYATLGNPGRAHGVDCSIIATWTDAREAPDPWRTELVSRWSAACRPWARTQSLFFLCSAWLTAGWVLVSTIAMYRYRPRRW